MPSVAYTSMQPTGDAVTYNDDAIRYPGPEVTSTFGPIQAPKVYGRAFSAFEIASSGKVAMTLSDAHVLDFVNSVGTAEVFVNARSNALVLGSDISVAKMKLSEGGAFVSAASKGVFLSTDSTRASFSNHAVIESANNAAIASSNVLQLGAGTEWLAQAGSNMSLLSYGPVSVDSHRYQEFKIQGREGARLAADSNGRLRLSAESLTSRDGFVTLSAYRPDNVPTAWRSGPRSGPGPAYSGTASRDGELGVFAEDPFKFANSNDVAGVLVDSLHVPQTDNLAFFNKGLVWRHGAEGMKTLGATAPACLSESYWDFGGGAVRFSYTNPSTGAKLGYHWRINERDELELVKVSTNHDGTTVRFNVAAKFGLEKQANGAYVPGFTRDRGRIVYRLRGVDSAHTVDTRKLGAAAVQISGPRSKPELVSGLAPDAVAAVAPLTGDGFKSVLKLARVDLETETFSAFENYNFGSVAFRRYAGWRPSTADVVLAAASGFRTAAPLTPAVNHVLSYALSNECVPGAGVLTGATLAVAGRSDRSIVENVVYTVSTVVMEDTAALDPVTGLTYRSIKPQVADVLTPESTPPEIDYFEYSRALRPDALHETLPNSVTAIGATVPLEFLVSDNYRVARLYFFQRDEAIVGSGPAADDDYFWDAARAVHATSTVPAGAGVRRAYADAAGRLHYVLGWKEARCLYQASYGDDAPGSSAFNAVNPVVSTPARLLDVYRVGGVGTAFRFDAHELAEVAAGTFPPAGHVVYATEAAMRAALPEVASVLVNYRAAAVALVTAHAQYAWMPSGEDIRARAAAGNSFAATPLLPGAFEAGAGAEAALAKTAPVLGGASYAGAVWRFGSDANEYRVTEQPQSVEATLAPAVASAPDYVRDPASGRALFFPTAPHFPTLPSGYELSAARSGHGSEALLAAGQPLPAWDPLGSSFSNCIELSSVGARSTAFNYLAAEDAWGNVTTLAAEVLVLRPITVLDENTVLVQLSTRKTSLQDPAGYALYTDLMAWDAGQPDNLTKIISDLTAYNIVSIDMVVVADDVQLAEAHSGSSANAGRAAWSPAGNYPMPAGHSADYDWVDRARVALTAGLLPASAPLRSSPATSASVLTRLTEAQVGALNEGFPANTFVTDPAATGGAGAAAGAFVYAQNTDGALMV